MRNKKKFLSILLLIFFIDSISESLAITSIYQLQAKKFKYLDNNKLILAEGEAVAKDQFGKQIFSDLIIYDKEKSIIRTKNNSVFIDEKGNKIIADNFFYDLNIKKIIAKKNVKFFDTEGNKFLFDQLEYLENLQKGYGENLKGLLSDKSSIQGEIAEFDNVKKTLILKKDKIPKNFFKKLTQFFNGQGNYYTTCKDTKNLTINFKERCPDWSISTINTTHLKNEGLVKHKHAIINIKNIPVFYTPYFSHPDPSVKRKSGFMPPSTKNFENLGRTFKTPYFFVIDKNSDLTFTPIFYLNENSVFLAEYRKQYKNSYLYFDTSYSKGYKDINKKNTSGDSLGRTGGSRNHLFANLVGSYEDLLFRNSDLELNIQRISQKNYLKVNQINTNFVKESYSSLKNNISLSSYEDNKRIKISTSIFENLNEENSNTKYQYTIPEITYNDHFKKYGYNFALTNFLEAKNYDGDSNKISEFNKIEITSDDKILKSLGLSNIFKVNLNNINVYNENVNTEKNNINSDIITTVGIQTSFPLIKVKSNTEEILKPQIFAKYTPGKMSNQSEGAKILSYNDIYSMDRMNSTTNPEKGGSMGYGFDYNLDIKDDEQQSLINSNFSLGQVINLKNIEQMPAKSSLNKKKSNYVGNFNLSLNSKSKNKKEINNNIYNSADHDLIKNGLNLKYNFNVNNNLNKFLKNDISLSFKNSNNLISANYYELNEIGSDKYIEGKYEKNFNNNYNLILKARKNLELDYSENNSLEFNYESDCLKIGASLTKTFYENQDLKADKNLTLFITLKPFGQPISPDLSSYIN